MGHDKIFLTPEYLLKYLGLCNKSHFFKEYENDLTNKTSHYDAKKKTESYTTQMERLAVYALIWHSRLRSRKYVLLAPRATQMFDTALPRAYERPRQC